MILLSVYCSRNQVNVYLDVVARISSTNGLQPDHPRDDNLRSDLSVINRVTGISGKYLLFKGLAGEDS